MVKLVMRRRRHCAGERQKCARQRRPACRMASFSARVFDNAQLSDPTRSDPACVQGRYPSSVCVEKTGSSAHSTTPPADSSVAGTSMMR